jgi:hypothetical protein
MEGIDVRVRLLLLRVGLLLLPGRYRRCPAVLPVLPIRTGRLCVWDGERGVVLISVQQKGN